MSVAEFTILVHGLKFDDCAPLDQLRATIERAVRHAVDQSPLYGHMFDVEQDVEVELTLHSGKCVMPNDADKHELR